MALTPIFRQPVRMGEIPEKDYADCDNLQEYCTLYKTHDPIYVQLKNDPCGENLQCNGGFETSDNLILNGTFDTNLDEWTSPVWIWNAGAAIASSGGELDQLIAGLTPGQTYIVSFSILDIENAELFVNLQDGTYTSPYNANGSYSVAIVCGANTGFGLDFLVSAIDIMEAMSVRIDNVTLVSTACWDFGDGWSAGNGVACHSPGSAGDLSEDILGSLSAGDYISVEFAVFSQSAGEVEVFAGGTSLGVVTQNGTYTLYGNTALTDTLLKFSSDADFNGCISLQSVYKYTDDDDLEGAVFVTDLDGNLITIDNDIDVNKDRINISIPPGDDLIEGCYKLHIVDPCPAFGPSIDPDLQTELIDDPDFDVDGLWTVQNGVTFSISGGSWNQSTAPIPPGSAGDNDGSVFIPIGLTTTPGFLEIVVETGDFDSPSSTLEIVYADFSAIVIDVIATVSNPLPNQTYRILMPFTFNSGGSFLGLVLTNNDIAAGNVNEVLSFSLKHSVLSEILSGILSSNCISVKDDVGNALLVWGEQDQNRSLGFLFDSNFPYTGGSRLFLSFTNPHDPTNQGNYLYSTGAKKKTFAQLEAMYDLQFWAVDQNMHRTIAAILASDHFRMGELTSYREYICVDKSYEPLWAKKTATGLAESVVEVGRISDTVFN